jgi:hypothetical protein
MSRLQVILIEIDRFFDRVNLDDSNVAITDLSERRILQLRLSKALKSIQKKLKS